ncbi:MAG: polysaccharide deacetylase family protein [Planctomycetes bacterium]|nr:polysaccharide deacetylase family protein [Planctomycetota bacterium]
MSTPSFQWPDGRRVAVSLSFDDARLSQVDRGLPILDAHGVKATFYVSFSSLEKRLEGWRRAAASGHEIGNHTVTHPCSGNFRFARSNALEDYTLERMEKELTDASDRIERLLGVRPRTFAYPCGQKFVGRGENVRSYVPLIARHFVVGRGFLDETHNSPVWSDLAQATGVEFDGTSFEKLQARIDQAAGDGGWLILAGHEIGDDGRQTVLASTLDALCRHARQPSSGIWLDTVAAIGSYVLARRART